MLVTYFDPMNQDAGHTGKSQERRLSVFLKIDPRRQLLR